MCVKSSRLLRHSQPSIEPLFSIPVHSFYSQGFVFVCVAHCRTACVLASTRGIGFCVIFVRVWWGIRAS